MPTKEAKLKVPLLRQGEGTNDCGPTCVSMVLNYYSIKNDVNQLTKDIRKIDKKMKLPDDSYTYVPQLGLYFLKQGFKVEIVTFNPFLFTYNDHLNVNPIKSLKAFHERVKNKKKVSVEIKRPAKFFIDFIENGGKVVVKIPDEKDIRTEIEHRRPMITLLTSRFLYKQEKKSGFNFHANVITGIDEKYVYVNDPLAGANGGRIRHSIPEFLFGVYASAYGAPDNASLLKIKR